MLDTHLTYFKIICYLIFSSELSDTLAVFGGLDILVSSDIPTGSGLSSSAAFEVLIDTVIDCIYNGGEAGAEKIARIGQAAENIYFGKASGLMDQMASALGGLAAIDFEIPDSPRADRIDFSLEDAG